MHQVQPPAASALGVFGGESDIGEGAGLGSCAYDGNRQTYALASGGADGVHYVWRRLAGDFIVTCRAALAGEASQLGWMARATLDPDSPHVSAAVSGEGRVALRVRRGAGDAVEELPAPADGPDVVRLERVGGVYRMSVARHGDLLASREVAADIGDEVYVGLFVRGGAAEFRSVRVDVPAAPGFVRGRDPFASRLEIVEVATGERQVVLESAGVFEAPNWTPDGASLIYNSEGRLYRFGLASGLVTPIDTGEVVSNNNDHVLSFDGTTLGISSAVDGASIIYTVPATGGIPRRVTARGPSYLHGWSPDGRYLVYTALRDGDYDIYRIPAKGGEEERLTTAPGLDDGPEYAPDGSFIYFNSARGGTMQIWRMRPDGSAQEQLTDDAFQNWFPHISPDGRWIVFLTYLDPVAPSDHPPAKRVCLRLMPAAGGEPRVLAYLYGGQGTINVPSWSPDSARLAFVSNTVAL